MLLVAAVVVSMVLAPRQVVAPPVQKIVTASGTSSNSSLPQRLAALTSTSMDTACLDSPSAPSDNVSASLDSASVSQDLVLEMAVKGGVVVEVNPLLNVDSFLNIEPFLVTEPFFNIRRAQRGEMVRRIPWLVDDVNIVRREH